MSAAGYIFLDDQGRILLLRGTDGVWNWVGGGMETGESALDTADREAEEEVGQVPPFSTLQTFQGPDYVTFVAHVGFAFQPTLSEEHTDWGWFYYDELPAPLHPKLEITLEGFNPGGTSIMARFLKHRRQRRAVDIAGEQWFGKSRESELIHTLEDWGEDYKTGKVFWHKGKGKYLLVPGNPTETEIAQSLSETDKYGDPLPGEAEKQMGQLEYVTLDDIYDMAEKYEVKLHYVDNVYKTRRRRERYKRPARTERPASTRRRRQSAPRLVKYKDTNKDKDRLFHTLERWGREGRKGKVFWYDNGFYLVPSDLTEEEMAEHVSGDGDPRTITKVMETMAYVSKADLKDIAEAANVSVDWDLVDEAFFIHRKGRTSMRTRRSRTERIRRPRRRSRIAKGWEDLPRGWTKESAESFWNSVGGSVSKCIKKLESAEGITDPGAVCSSLADIIEPGWRHEPRKRTKKRKPYKKSSSVLSAELRRSARLLVADIIDDLRYEDEVHEAFSLNELRALYGSVRSIPFSRAERRAMAEYIIERERNR